MLSKKEILARKRKFNFASGRFIEIFSWDFAILKMLNSIDPDMILKGGAGVQLYLPVEKQRASIDLDLMTSRQKGDVEEIFRKIEFVERYTPKKAVVNLPLITYIAKLNSVIGNSRLEVKIDAFYDEKPKIKPKIIKSKKLFALNINFPIKVASEGYLIGDKLLTLATRSVGIPRHRLPELPKHVYDIARLTERVSMDTLHDLIYSFRYNLKREREIKNLAVTEIDVLNNIIVTLDKFSKIDISGIPDPMNLKRDILNFQSQYLTNMSRLSLSEWLLDSLRIKFLIRMIRRNLSDEISLKEVLEGYNQLLKELAGLKTMSRVKRQKRSQEFLKEIKVPYWKQLKGKPLERIYLELRNSEVG